MTDYKTLWWEKMLAKYGSEEAVRAMLSASGKKAKGIPKKSGFYNDSEKARQAGIKGSASRWSKDEAQQGN